MRRPPQPPRRLRGALLVVAAVVLAACGSDEAAGPPVPDDSYETFEGETTSLAAYEGEPLVVNFWASWCPPCIAEMPDFERVHSDLADEVAFVGLNTQDSLPAAEELVAETGVTYDLGLDPDGELFRAFEVSSMPSTFFVDTDGRIVHRQAGLITEQQLRDLIDEHLLEGAAA